MMLPKAFLKLCFSSRALPKCLAFSTAATLSSNSFCAPQVADVHLVPMFQDNYGFVMTDRDTGDSACVDAGDGDAILLATKNKFNLKMLLCTHKHSDHVGGNNIIHSQYPQIDIVATKYEHIPAATKLVGDGDSLRFGSLNINVIHVPCHTKGHVAYYVTKSLPDPTTAKASPDSTLLAPLLFCGDTLFVGGCGRFFEGTAADMLQNMDKFAALPHNTVVYCAHEYTESNLKFLADIDPENCKTRYDEVKRLRSKGISTVPSTIGRELEYNLFMKCHKKRTQELVSATSAVEAMNKLRTMKNNFV